MKDVCDKIMCPMKDRDDIIIMPFDSKLDPKTKKFVATLVPIIDLKEESQGKIIGMSFLVIKDEIMFAVTANHVLTNLKNLFMQFLVKGGPNLTLGIDIFKEYGIDWIKHHELDLAVLPVLLPKEMMKKIVNLGIIKKSTHDCSTIKKGHLIKHLSIHDGSPMREENFKNKDQTPCVFIGTFEKSGEKTISITSSAHFGDSGSPLFLEGRNEMRLIGVVTHTGTITKITNKEDGEYTGETTAIPINHVFDVINSKPMRKMIINAKKKLSIENGQNHVSI